MPYSNLNGNSVADVAVAVVVDVGVTTSEEDMEQSFCLKATNNGKNEESVEAKMV